MISVIIPTYNYAHFIEASVKSVQAQSYSDWECIVIDDGSTDNTKFLIDKLIKEDSRIKYFYQENRGPAVARNLGIKESKGDFIQFLDGDDLLEAKKFEKQLSTFNENTEYDIVYGGGKYFNSETPEKLFLNINLNSKNTWMPCISGKGEKIILTLIKENIMVISSPLIRKSVFNNFGGFDESIHYNEDWELWLRFAMKNIFFKFNNEDQTNALIRVHSSYSKNNLKMFVYGLKVCLKISTRIDEYKYNKVLIPKINYHKKIIDEKLIELISIDSSQALECIEWIYKETKLKQYKYYLIWYKKFNRRQFFLLTKMFSYYNKISSILMYGS